MSMRGFSTPDMISAITFCRGVALGLSLELLEVGDQLAVHEFETAFLPVPRQFFALVRLRLLPPWRIGAAQSFQR